MDTPRSPTSSFSSTITAISALHALHAKGPFGAVLEEPSANQPTPFQVNSRSHSLSFDEEKKLAGCCAFLAYPVNDPNRIPAVCIDNLPDETSLSVRIALNRSRSAENKGCIAEIVKRMQDIFDLMSHVDNQENTIFKKIVSFCSTRILQRLNLIQRKKKKMKIPWDTVLQTTSDLLRHKEIRMDGQRQAVETFLSQSKVIIKSTDAWRKHQTLDALERLVTSIFSLDHDVRIVEVIRHLTDRDMQPSSRKSVCNVFAKVARYRRIAHFFHKRAEKNGLYRRIRVFAVDLPDTFFQRPELPEFVSGLDSIIHTSHGRGNKQKIATAAFQYLKTTPQDANKGFNDIRHDTAQNSKVHAEIQLLYFYEMNRKSTHPLPRVIYSSKDACWLCNLFIKLHGQMYTPRCHGVLYPGWRLPEISIPPFDKMRPLFIQALNTRLDDAVRTLFQRQTRTSYAPPNESRVSSLPAGASTVNLLVSPDSNGQLPDCIRVNRSTSTINPTVQTPRHESNMVSEAKAAAPGINQIDPEGSETPLEDLSDQHSLLTPNFEVDESRTYKAQAAETLGRNVSITATLLPGQSSVIYKTKDLELQIELDEQPILAQGESPRALVYTITRMNSQDERALEAKYDGHIIEARDIVRPLNHVMDDADCIHVSAGETVLRIRRENGVISTFESRS